MSREKAMNYSEIAGPPFFASGISFADHADAHSVAVLHNRFELPGLTADEAVRGGCGIAASVCKPREANRYASANGSAVLPSGPGAYEKHFLRTTWLPRSDVRSVQIHLSRRGAAGDADLRQSAVAGGDFGESGYSETAIKL